jgi:hypothetical protein
VFGPRPIGGGFPCGEQDGIENLRQKFVCGGESQGGANRVFLIRVVLGAISWLAVFSGY